MRKNGWQLPYHPLQVVAVAVFLALGFAFYVFFAPFVGNKFFQYAAMCIYTPLIVSVFSLYICSAAADPADPGVFKSKKYLKVKDNKKQVNYSQSQQGGEGASSIQDPNTETDVYKGFDKGDKDVKSKVDNSGEFAEKTQTLSLQAENLARFAFLPCACFSYCSRAHEESSEQHTSEDGMFYCSLCEVEVLKYSKHCRVCDKCVNRFDHHCRWLNNCIGKKNYRKFFALMVSAILLLVFQWSIGILVLICCFIEKHKFSLDITTKLGSSFTIVPFAIVVAVCTVLAMIATLPLAQLFFFHILLIKKGISTYDYIIALREQEQGNGGQQSPQMSSVSSITGLSSASSFNNFQRVARCTPPRLFLDDQFDVVNPETGSVSSRGKKVMLDEQVKKKNTVPVKISPWTLARMNADEVSKAAADARKKSKTLQPVMQQQPPRYSLETESSYSSSGRRMGGPRLDNNKKRSSKRIRLPAELSHEPLTTVSREGAEISKRHMMTDSFRAYVPPLQLETRGSFMPKGSMPNASVNVSSSPESSLDSPELHAFGVSGTEEIRRLVGLSAATLKETPLSSSTSDGYDASGGEDSDRVPPRIIPRSSNWSNILFGSEQETFSKFNVSSSSVQNNTRK